MQIVRVLLFLTLVGCASKHSQMAGVYTSDFNQRIKLKSDSTFYHNWGFDLGSSWSVGKWRISKDTLYLNTELVMDTLQVQNLETNSVTDSLVISTDNKVNRIENSEYLISMLSSGGQNRVKPPTVLIKKRKKIYIISQSKKSNLFFEKSSK
jgi:hypothetical protein